MGWLFVNVALAVWVWCPGAILVGMDKVAMVLAELREEQKRLTLELARVGRVIAALEEAAKGVASSASDEAPVVSRPAAEAVPAVKAAPALPRGVGPYSLLSIYEAAARYLASVDEPQTSRQIADALRAGGFKTRSENFTGTVRTLLMRAEPSRAAGISRTSNGKRWFVRKKE